MIERSDRIELDPKEARCHRNDCGNALGCARRLATIQKGSPLMDGLAESPTAVLGWCSQYLSAKFRDKTKRTPTYEVKPIIRGIV